VTANGSDLRIGVAGRPWRNGAGRENFPDGEVFTSPIEDATEGTVVFDFPAILAGERVQGVRLTFRGGQVVEATATYGESWLVRMLDQVPGARQLAEVAIGCNYAIDRPLGHPLVDEKIGGTFHVALGALPQASGQHSPLHGDLIADLRPGGQIEADGRIISENGRFVDPQWPQK
jgi:aminopeptidase